VEAQADVKVKDNDGFTPLHEAARTNQKSVVDTLLMAPGTE